MEEGNINIDWIKIINYRSRLKEKTMGS